MRLLVLLAVIIGAISALNLDAETPSDVSPEVPAAAAPPAQAAPLVRLDAAAAVHPQAGVVAELLDRHFGAINDRDFDEWQSTVTAVRAADQSEGDWSRAYRSTYDEDVVVSSIAEAPGGLVVGLSFVSNQDVADAPADLPAPRICWSSTWLVEINDAARVAGPPEGATSRRAC